MLVSKNGARIGEYFIKRAPYYEKRINRLYKPKVEREIFKINFIEGKSDEKRWIEPVRYGTHQVTAIAIPVEEEKNSVFSENKKRIYDICLLYNFFTGQNTCLKEDIWRFTHLKKEGTVLGKEVQLSVGYLINETLKVLESWDVAEKDKEILAFLFLLDARNPKPLQIRFVEEFMALEILGINSSRSASLFAPFANGITYFNEVDFKYTLKIIRNKYVHEGKCSLLYFKNGMNNYKERIQFTYKFERFINSIDDERFNEFKVETWIVMDYLLSCIFLKIFGKLRRIRKLLET